MNNLEEEKKCIESQNHLGLEKTSKVVRSNL